MLRSPARRRCVTLAVTVLLGHAVTALAPAAAQLPTAPPPAPGASRPDTSGQADAVKVFLDCQSRFCDRDFFVVEIPFVNWMRDRIDADVLLLVTTLRTGSGGQEVTATFLGQRRFAGQRDTLVTTTLPNDADDVGRRELVRLFRIGLARYVARTSLGRSIDVAFRAPTGKAVGAVASPQNTRDPWNFWVFRVGGNASINGEQRQSFGFYGLNASARRTTADLSVVLTGGMDLQRQRFTLSTGEFVNALRSNFANALVVRSAGEHWSWGGKVLASRSDFSNEALQAFAGPAIEYNVFPYSRATRERLTFLYTIGPVAYRFKETTILNLDQDTRVRHQLFAGWVARKPWGSVNLSASGSQFLPESQQWNARVSGGFDLRLSKGLQIGINGFYSRVRDQIGLPRGQLTDEQILVRQRLLQTNYFYGAFVNVNYTFGSIFNTVVNPRFPSQTGGGGTFYFF
jgi:hypothetical protein